MTDYTQLAVDTILCDSKKQLFIIQNKQKKWQLIHSSTTAKELLQAIRDSLWQDLGLSPNNYTILGGTTDEDDHKATFAVQLRPNSSIFLNDKRIRDSRFITADQVNDYIEGPEQVLIALRLFKAQSL